MPMHTRSARPRPRSVEDRPDEQQRRQRGNFRLPFRAAVLALVNVRLEGRVPENFRWVGVYSERNDGCSCAWHSFRVPRCLIVATFAFRMIAWAAFDWLQSAALRLVNRHAVPTNTRLFTVCLAWHCYSC